MKDPRLGWFHTMPNYAKQKRHAKPVQGKIDMAELRRRTMERFKRVLSHLAKH